MECHDCRFCRPQIWRTYGAPNKIKGATSPLQRNFDFCLICHNKIEQKSWYFWQDQCELVSTGLIWVNFLWVILFLVIRLHVNRSVVFPMSVKSNYKQFAANLLSNAPTVESSRDQIPNSYLTCRDVVCRYTVICASEVVQCRWLQLDVLCNVIYLLQL